ncbi:hypothetical protein [Burkholderia ubonensis]|uniref:hypothetical protein n=1 Tax=Burkholderia ubonensis TaxID=101571 RepID=UPI0009B3B7D1|nr:hypothetical protein [Burkholderia ubonensis]
MLAIMLIDRSPGGGKYNRSQHGATMATKRKTNAAIAFEHHNERHPHKALKYRSPREFRRAALSST